MNPGRSLLQKITYQLIYLIIVAALVALSLKAFSKEPLHQVDYHYNIIKISQLGESAIEIKKFEIYFFELKKK